MKNILLAFICLVTFTAAAAFAGVSAAAAVTELVWNSSTSPEAS